MKHCCEKCGSWDSVEKHHTFPGRALRPVSERYGAYHYLCRYCHQDAREGVQHNGAKALELKMADQHRVMVEQEWTVEEWRLAFGKNFLDEEELEEIREEIAMKEKALPFPGDFALLDGPRLPW